MIVDDSALILKMATDLIVTHYGDQVRIFTASSGEEALEIYGQEQIDVIVLDVVMPGLNGVDVLKYMNTHHVFDRTKVVMCTSLSDKSFVRECFELGASDYILKPLDADEFRARINSALNEQKLKKELHYSVQLMKEQNDELQSLYRQLVETQSQLMQKEQLVSISQLAAGVAHEINTPLGYVTSNVTTLKNYLRNVRNFVEVAGNRIKEVGSSDIPSTGNDVPDFLLRLWKSNDMDFILSDIEEISSDIQQGLSKIDFIVQSLRSFSMVDKSDELVRYNINEAVEQVIFLVSNDNMEAIRIHKRLEVETLLHGNGRELNLAILNIMKNAIDAIKAVRETGNVWIETNEKEDAICCRIRDDGKGIPEDKLSSIFNPFYTTGSAGSRIGLGLSIAYDIIVNKHGGQIEVNSRLNEGSEFIITLPKNLKVKI